MDANIQNRIQKWLDGPYDSSTKAEIRLLLKENPAEIADAFYTDLSFGTGGLRGIMGIGTNRMNIYTVRTATQGLANYIQEHRIGTHRIFIGYDIRLHSRLFAEESARVFAGNGIQVLITKEVCPTPLASYACRAYECSAAIMITASHNPSQYNGYKVFWSDGSQIVAPHDAGIFLEMQRIQNPGQIRIEALDSPLIQWIGDEIDQKYLEETCSTAAHQCQLRLIYTNLHGTGLRLLPKALRRQGFSSISFVEKQLPFDGHFSNAPSPNPEEELAMKAGCEQLMKEQADLLLATDPDADRLGVVVRHNGAPIKLNGHETAAICLEYLASCYASNGAAANMAFVKTIVTSELTRKIALKFSIQCHDVLTGFKYIAEKIREWEKAGGPQFLFGAEESCGYLANTSVRDKDAISAGCLVCLAAENAKKQNLTLIDRLHKLYRIHGVHRQSLKSLKFADGRQGMQYIRSAMDKLRKTPITDISGQKVIRCDDYLQQISIETATHRSIPLSLPIADVMCYWLADDSKIVIRPSGTEPKIKIYAETCETPADYIEESIARCDQKLITLIDAFKEQLPKELSNNKSKHYAAPKPL